MAANENAMEQDEMASDPTARLNAALEGRYRIERELGAGGMATVFLAEDLKHDRKVAIKVLKPELAAILGAERFLAEIRTTAHLQHPNILPLFDSGQADGMLFYVMPYVPGESLRERIDRAHQLPVEESVRISTNLAEALDYAHGLGIVHRDLKPANVLIVQGKPVLADFGIALAVGAAGQGRMTETGLSLGTPHYMSPEQATGDPHVGPASDIYALGCVTYEMLVGQPPHTGSTAQAILGKIMTETPAGVRAQRPTVPANVDAVIRRALEKVPADRFANGAEFARALADPAFRHGADARGGAPGAAAAWRRGAIAAGVTALAAFGVAAWALTRPLPEPPPRAIARFESPFREGQAPLNRWLAPFRDGSALVYTGPGDEPGTAQLWIRRWRDLEATRIPGTGQVGHVPAVSPDGGEVVYPTGNPGPLRITPVQGGSSRTIVDVAYGPLAWSDDGWIYYRSADNVLARVRPSGGSPDVLTELAEGEAVHWLPHPLPGGRKVLFTVAGRPTGDEASIAILDLETRERRSITSGNTPVFVAPRHLLFATGGGTLMSAPFDPVRGELAGEPTTVMEGLGFDRDYLYMTYAVADDGTLTYWTDGGRSEYQFMWITRDGIASPIPNTQPFSISNEGNIGWRLSPDGRRIAFRRTVEGNDDIWIQDLPNGALSRLTFSDAMDAVPTWASDGSVTWRSGALGEGHAWKQAADGSGRPERIFDEFDVGKAVWSPDGQWLVIRRAGVVGRERARDIYAMRPGIDSVAIPLVADPAFWEQGPSISRDGRWLAYSSNETGRHEIFVRPFPDVEGGKWQISTGGAVAAVWGHNGHELFFVDLAKRAIAAVTFTSDAAAFQHGPVHTVFEIPPDIFVSGAGNMDVFDVAPGDERFLMARLTADGAGSRGLILVQNFASHLRGER